MSDQPETLAAILAEMRDPCAPRAHSLPALADRIEAALAAPPRNCDVGTAEEQAERHGRFCAAHYKADAVDAQCFGCPASDKKETDCEFVWGQLPFAPAEGGDHA